VCGGLFAGTIIALLGFALPIRLGWWWIVVAPAVAIFSWIPGAIFIQLLAMTIEWLGISVFPCRRCRSHRFSFGKTHGFGL
jgi:hypothetical protein